MTREINSIERTPAVGKVLADLRERIFRLNLKNGDTFTEAALAKEYGVSRGSIRSALHKLENEGLLTTLSNGRKVITGINEKFLVDLYEIRTMCERKAVETCLLRDIDCAPLAMAMSHFYTMQTSSTGDFYIERANANTGFHRALFATAGNRSLIQCWETIEPILHAVVMYNYRQLGQKSDDAETVRIHTRLLEMIIRKDPAALDEIERHVRVAADESLGFYRETLRAGGKGRSKKRTE